MAMLLHEILNGSALNVKRIKQINGLKLIIIKKTNTIENVGQLTVSVKKKFDKIVGQ